MLFKDLAVFVLLFLTNAYIASRWIRDSPYFLDDIFKPSGFSISNSFWTHMLFSLFVTPIFFVCVHRLLFYLRIRRCVIDRTVTVIKVQRASIDQVGGLERRRTTMTDFLSYSATELQCSICNELFIKPRVINCGHIMCLFCLTEWKKEQKNCPLCRCLITSHCRCPTIENIVDRIVGSYPDSLKKERSEAIISRDDIPAVPKVTQNLDNQNRLQSNLEESRSAVAYIYTSLFNRPEYLDDSEIIS